jgi:hypothetical protein
MLRRRARKPLAGAACNHGSLETFKSGIRGSRNSPPSDVALAHHRLSMLFVIANRVRYRHVDHLAILQGIGCELWNRLFSDFRVGPYFGPDLAHQT